MDNPNCLSCGHSFSTDEDELICVLNQDEHTKVDEDHSCKDFN